MLISLRANPDVAGNEDGILALGTLPVVKSSAFRFVVSIFAIVAYSSCPTAVDPLPVTLFTFKYLSTSTSLSGRIIV